ncbi:MAG TPA: heparan-alpha-glucosaminide N-acetyltransferase domain-containing protein [Candidatus Lokiarchaeia archaeon]|nr:heparan-alpha-glucosaminide N-acetyltransferase domain-containing protein [Candidatus Lokiarchaeia archaeon]
MNNVLHETTTPPVESSANQKPRFLSIDIFRGATIVVMIFVNFVDPYTAIPDWSKHAPGIGLTYVDLVAPFFIFAIALTYHQSYRRSLEKQGPVETFLKFLRRYFALLGIGLIYGFTLDGYQILFDWAALPAIGLAGLFTFIFIRFSRKIRLFIGIALLVIYQFLLQMQVEVNGTTITIATWNANNTHGGFIGAFGFGILMVFGTVVAESFESKRMKDFIWFGIVCTAAGILTSGFIVINGWVLLYPGVSKHVVSTSYILVSLGLACLAFYFTWYLYDVLKITKGSSKFLQPIGKNSLWLYILSGLFILILQGILPPDAQLIFVLLVAVALIVSEWAIGFYMDKKSVYLII